VLHLLIELADKKECVIKKNGDLILKGPIKRNQKWKIKTLQGEGDSSTKLQLKESYVDCRIDNFIILDIQGVSRNCAEVKCNMSNDYIKQIYCSNIGYIGSLAMFNSEEKWTEKVIDISK